MVFRGKIGRAVAALAVGSVIAIVPPALPEGTTASAAPCPKSGCGWSATQWQNWRQNNPKAAKFFDVLDWMVTIASFSPAGPVPARTFGRAFGHVGTARPINGMELPVRWLPELETVAERALGEVNEAFDILDEAAAGPGLTGEQVQPELDIARADAEALAQDLLSVYDGTATADMIEADLARKIQSAAADLLREAVAISDASAEGAVPTYDQIGSFDGDSSAMSADNKDLWNANWREEVVTEVKSESGQLGKKNKAIARLLEPNGRIGKVPGAADTYTKLVGDFADSLADPTKPAADATVKFDNLQKEFAEPNKQGVEMTYLPKGNLDNVREAIAAKRMFEAGITDFKPGEPVSGLTPDYVATDGTFLGDAVRMSGQRTADAFKSGIRAKIGEKVAVYAERTGKPVRVVIDASGNPALAGSSLTDFQSLVSAGVQSAPSTTTAKLKDVVVLGPGGMLAQTDPTGRILTSAQAVRAKRSHDHMNPSLPTAWLIDQHSGKCLGASSAQPFAPWTLQPCDRTSAKQMITLTTRGQLRVFRGDDALCAAPNGTHLSAPVWSRSCTLPPSQAGLTWRVDTAGHITNTQTGLVLDVYENRTDDGAPVTVYKSSNKSRDSNQNFDFITRTTDQPMPLVNPSTGKCLTAPDTGGWDERIVMKTCDGSAGQRFTYNSENRHIEVNGGRGLQCLNASWTAATIFSRASAHVTLRDCSRYADKWNFNADGTMSSWYILQSRTVCMDITGDSRREGAEVGLYDCHANYHNQRFTQFSLTSL